MAQKTESKNEVLDSGIDTKAAAVGALLRVRRNSQEYREARGSCYIDWKSVEEEEEEEEKKTVVKSSFQRENVFL